MSIEEFVNKKFIIIGYFVASTAILYFFRVHFATIIISYGMGCLACYYGLKLNYLNIVLEQLKCHLVQDDQFEHKLTEVSFKGCATCGSKECSRQDAGVPAEPWVGLQVHKQLDQAIEEFYNTILDQFINSWYSKLTVEPFFVDELRLQLRYASACLLRRALKINYSKFITERLLPCALHHYTLCSGALRGESLVDNKMAVHPAAVNRNAELKYLRSITNAIMPYLLKNSELQNTVFRVLVKEIFAGWVLLSMTDTLADPYIVNTLIVLLTGGETMAPLPSNPDYQVEFLETFTRHSESVYSMRSKLLQLDVETVISDQDHLYAFMQFVKSGCHVRLLRFYKDIKSFQMKLLNPELSGLELAAICREAEQLHARYLSRDHLDQAEGPLPLPTDLRDELTHLLLLVKDTLDVKRLQTSRALYQAARHSHDYLQRVLLPMFLHSEEFYNLLLGPRIPIGYHKQMFKRPLEKKLYHRVKPQSSELDGNFNEANSIDIDGIENMDVLKYLDALAGEEGSERDLNGYKVVLTNVEVTLQMPPRRGTVRVFTLCVHCADRTGDISAARLWNVFRSEHDFHLLRAKLQEFHGATALADLSLPSRRDNSPLETLRYKYEDFLQRLLRKSLLSTSELLHLFLTVDGDFTFMVQASTLGANTNDLANIYQNVAHRLRKEKGQHLESFLTNLLVSSDKDRYQTLKQGQVRDVEEAVEVSEEIEVEQLTRRRSNARNIYNEIFDNNLGMESLPPAPCTTSNEGVPAAGFSYCLVYFLKNIVRGRTLVLEIVGALVKLTRGWLDEVVDAFLQRKLRDLLSERTLAHFIRLGQDVIFGKSASRTRNNPVEKRLLAYKQLVNAIPAYAGLVLGPGVTLAAHNAFEILQRPHLNKQLVYNLLDLWLLELFPELASSDIGSSTGTNV